jgi:hypothetical protein
MTKQPKTENWSFEFNGLSFCRCQRFVPEKLTSSCLLLTCDDVKLLVNQP